MGLAAMISRTTSAARAAFSSGTLREMGGEFIEQLFPAELDARDGGRGLRRWVGGFDSSAQASLRTAPSQ